MVRVKAFYWHFQSLHLQKVNEILSCMLFLKTHTKCRHIYTPYSHPKANLTPIQHSTTKDSITLFKRAYKDDILCKL